MFSSKRWMDCDFENVLITSIHKSIEEHMGEMAVTGTVVLESNQRTVYMDIKCYNRSPKYKVNDAYFGCLLLNKYV